MKSVSIKLPEGVVAGQELQVDGGGGHSKIPCARGSAGRPGAQRVLALLALLVQKYKY